jgi:hypothetical protein
MKRKKWEKINEFYIDKTGNLYGKKKGCYDCRRVFNPAAIGIPRMCGQMLLDGVKDNGIDDPEVYKDSTCKLFEGWE